MSKSLSVDFNAFVNPLAPAQGQARIGLNHVVNLPAAGESLEEIALSREFNLNGTYSIELAASAAIDNFGKGWVFESLRVVKISVIKEATEVTGTVSVACAALGWAAKVLTLTGAAEVTAAPIGATLAVWTFASLIPSPVVSGAEAIIILAATPAGFKVVLEIEGLGSAD